MLLTQKQKDILSGKLEVSSNYIRSVLSKKRRQIAKIMEDLKFVAEYKPELLNLEVLKEIVELILRHGEITTEERKVRSIVFEGKRKGGSSLKSAASYTKRQIPRTENMRGLLRSRKLLAKFVSVIAWSRSCIVKL